MFVAATAISCLKFSGSVNLLSKDATKLNPLRCIFREGIYVLKAFPFRSKDMAALYRMIN
jgi:hypothetical protein